MKNNPVIISLLVGLVVVLVVAGVSILVKMNALSGTYKQELAKSISLEKTIEDLKGDNGKLQKNIDGLKEQISNLQAESAKLNDTIHSMNAENLRLQNLNKKLEDNLKEELMSKKLQEG